MPQCVQAISRTLRVGRDAGSNLHRSEPSPVNVHEILDIAVAVRKHQPKAGLAVFGESGTRQFPFAQRVDDDWRERHLTLARNTLRRANRVPTIGALSHGQHLPLEVDVIPRQPAQFARAQPGKDCLSPTMAVAARRARAWRGSLFCRGCRPRPELAVYA